MGIGGAKKPEAKYVIPKEYEDPEKSKIEAEVTTAGPNEFKFNLEG